MTTFNRRDFLKGAIGATTALATGGMAVAALAAKKSATDWVTLGNSGIQVTRLAFGTGTFGGKIQRELGQENFTKVVRHAYDRGIRFFETADAYRTQGMLATALKGIPRDSYKLMTKFRWKDADNPQAIVDRLRKELNSDYFDILLLHCVRTTGWSEELKRLRDEVSEIKQKKIILAHGASCHGLLPLRSFPGNKWLDVVLVRINHDGARMDTLAGGDGKEKGDVTEAAAQIKKIHAHGTGVLGMKLVGEGQFTTPEQREASLKFVLGLGAVDAVTIACKNTAEVDEAIERMNRILNA